MRSKRFTNCFIVCAFLLITVQCSYAMTVKIHSENIDTDQVEETIDIDVMIEKTADVGSFQFVIRYNPEIVMIDNKQDVKIVSF